MTLNPDALEAAKQAYNRRQNRSLVGGGFWLDRGDSDTEALREAITAYLAHLPPQAGGPHAQEDPHARLGNNVAVEERRVVRGSCGGVECVAIDFSKPLRDVEALEEDWNKLSSIEKLQRVGAVNIDLALKSFLSPLKAAGPPEPTLEERDLHAALSQPTQAKGPPKGEGDE